VRASLSGDPVHDEIRPDVGAAICGSVSLSIENQLLCAQNQAFKEKEERRAREGLQFIVDAGYTRSPMRTPR
jgi:hypothetical protein